MPVGTHRLAINEGLRDSVTCLSLTEAHHLGHDSRGSQLDQNDMVQADLVEGVLQSHAALNLVGPDHCLKHISDLEDLAIAEIASSLVCSCNPVGSCEDRPQVV